MPRPSNRHELLVLPDLPGQQPGRASAIFDQLIENFKPIDMFERMMLNDIADIVAKQEYCRILFQSYMQVTVERLQKDNVSTLQESELSQETINGSPRPDKSPATSMPGQVCDVAPRDDASLTIALAKLAADELERLAKIQSLEMKWMQERNRQIACFDRRRQLLLKGCLDQIAPDGSRLLAGPGETIN